jgi:RimJ/RimL family protein N-acetyltransferase
MPSLLQPALEDSWVRLRPLRSEDFTALYTVASDPLIWEQHPNPLRYRREVFEIYFKGAMESGGALALLDAANGQIMGSSRYYNLDERERSLSIGYTFIARAYWGRQYNRHVKTLMLDHAFSFVEQVFFQVGENNLRSRKAMEKLGATLIGTESVSYYGEPSRVNAIYRITRADWKPPRDAAA